MISWIVDVGSVDLYFANLIYVMREMGPNPSFLQRGSPPRQ